MFKRMILFLFVATACVVGQVTHTSWILFHQEQVDGAWRGANVGPLTTAELIEALDAMEADANKRLYRDDSGVVTGIHGGNMHEYVLVTEPATTEDGEWVFESAGVEYKYVIFYIEAGVNKVGEFTQEEAEGLKNQADLTIVWDQAFFGEKITATREQVTIPGEVYYIIQAP